MADSGSSGGIGSDPDSVKFLVDAFPQLATHDAEDLLHQHKGSIDDVLAILLQTQTPSRTGEDSGSQDVATPSFAQVARTKPEAQRRQQHPRHHRGVTKPSTSPHGHGQHRSWWRFVSEWNVPFVFGSIRRHGHVAKEKPMGLVGSSSAALAAAASPSTSSSASMLLSMFGSAMDTGILMDVLEFAAGSLHCAVDIVLRMMGQDEEEELDECGGGGGGGEVGMLDEKIAEMKAAFPNQDQVVLGNALEAADFDCKQAIAILRGIADPTDKGGEWTEAKKKTRSKKDRAWTSNAKVRCPTSLRRRFAHLDVSMLESVYHAMGGNVDRAVECLTHQMGFPERGPVAPWQAPASRHRPTPSPWSSPPRRGREGRDGPGGTGGGDDPKMQAQRCDQSMRICFAEAAAAFNRGCTKDAKHLSNKGKAYLRERTEWRMKAAKETCSAIGEAGKASYSLDLHGLKVEEAMLTLECLAKSVSKLEGKTKTLQIITGRGKGSQGGIPRIKLATESFLKENKLNFTIPENNPGCFDVHFN